MTVKHSAGKGSMSRPSFISDGERGLRYDLAFGNITKKQYDKKMKEYSDEKIRMVK